MRKVFLTLPQTKVLIIAVTEMIDERLWNRQQKVILRRARLTLVRNRDREEMRLREHLTFADLTEALTQNKNPIKGYKNESA